MIPSITKKAQKESPSHPDEALEKLDKRKIKKTKNPEPYLNDW